MYGPIQENEWQIRYNTELYQMYRFPKIITEIKVTTIEVHRSYSLNEQG